MRVLFVLLHPGYLRHYVSVIRELSKNGHDVHLAFNQTKLLNKKEGGMAKALSSEFLTVTYGAAPCRNDKWRTLARVIRGTQDYLRYFDSIYDNSPNLRARVGGKTGAKLDKIFNIFSFLKKPFFTKKIYKLFERIEWKIPSSMVVDNYLDNINPDVILVTPLINFASAQVDYIKSARNKGVPSALCVASWDNLTNKGLIRLSPDSVLVWNECQKQEAINLHNIQPGKVIVTGAQSYDKWFEKDAAFTYKAFCNRVGLDSSQKYLLYLCSSPFIAGEHEAEFVTKWIKAIRQSDIPELKTIGILIRPHPQNAKIWINFNKNLYSNVTLYPRKGANPITTDSESDFYDSIYHGSVVIGVNTSGMVESGIINRPVLTVLDDAFSGTQTGTLHFHHLVSQGLVHVASNLDEHIQQLSEGLNNKNKWSESNRKFVESFIRPHGYKVSSTLKVVSAIENLTIDSELYEYSKNINSDLLSKFSYGALYIFSVLSNVYARNKYGNKKKLAANKQQASTISRFFWRTAVRTLGILGLKEFVRGSVLPRLIAAIGNGKGVVIDIDRKLDFIKDSKGMLIIGPWLSEVGFEVLYWVPFVKYVCDKYQISKDRIIVISRGGMESMYEGITDNYYDVFDLFSVDEYRTMLERRWEENGGQKQTYIDALDYKLLKAAAKKFNSEKHTVLHPHLMYNSFHDYWKDRMGLKTILKYTNYKQIELRKTQWLHDLTEIPEEYVAIRFYFRPSFPDTTINREFIQKLLNKILKHTNIVMLNPGFEIDDHYDFSPDAKSKIYYIDNIIKARNNMDVQIQVIENANAFVGTYGGLSYIPIYCNVPCLAFYSENIHLIQGHIDLASRVARKRGVLFSVLDTVDIEQLNYILGGSNSVNLTEKMLAKDKYRETEAPITEQQIIN